MQNYLFSDKQKSQALFWLALFHIAVIASSNYLVQFPFTITLPNGFEVHSTWGALTFPFIFLSTDLTVRIFGQSLARRIVFFVMPPQSVVDCAHRVHVCGQRAGHAVVFRHRVRRQRRCLYGGKLAAHRLCGLSV